MAGTTNGWTATESTDPVGRNRELTVRGEVETGETSPQPTLREAEPQGFDPDVLLLDLLVPGAGDDGAHVRQVQFRKPVTERQYRQVQIRRDGGDGVTVDVELVES